MTTGRQVKCGRCTGHFLIYEDIQKKNVSICPYCNNIEGHGFDHEFTFEYNAGDGENGCPSHIDDEAQYDWEWLEYSVYVKPEPEIGDFDQDQDLINNNLGWED